MNMNKLNKYQDKIIVFIDSDCMVCNKFVLYIIKHDPGKVFLFSSQNSTFFKEKIKSPKDSIFVLADDIILSEGRAIHFIFKYLKGFSPIISKLFLSIVPIKFSDYFYRLFAKYRLKFNSINSCPLPSIEEKSRFID